MSAKRLLLGTRKGLLILERGAKKGWRVARLAHVGTPVAYATYDTSNETLWACLDHGHWGQKLTRSRNGGETWQEVPAPKYPEGAEIKKGVPATLRYLWTLSPGGKDQPGRLYLGTDPGGLFQSDDGGSTWRLVTGLWDHPSRMEKWMGGGRDQPGIHSILVDPRNSLRVLVGISCAGVFETIDGGTTWAPRNKGLTASFLPDPSSDVGHDPHSLDLCAASPDVVWQQNHEGVFRSTDGCASWIKVSEKDGPADFGFAVAADAEDPGTAWVVPGQSDANRAAVDGSLVVSRTEDGGETWTALRDGLPQDDCFDIVYRHGLDASGDRLAFASTTGNAYVSKDRGDSWKCLGNNFPPVYSVRFAED